MYSNLASVGAAASFSAILISAGLKTRCKGPSNISGYSATSLCQDMLTCATLQMSRACETRPGRLYLLRHGLLFKTMGCSILQGDYVCALKVFHTSDLLQV